MIEDTEGTVENKRRWFKNFFKKEKESFWTFLGENILSGNIAVLSKVYGEVSKGTDELAKWIVGLGLTIIDYRSPAIISKYQDVLAHIQTSTTIYNDKAFAEWADGNRADGWLVATAIVFGYELVTFERPNRSLGTSVAEHLKISQENIVCILT
ncbi:DUF4411 family protein [Lachnospiraceae bacterium ZAX-1]